MKRKKGKIEKYPRTKAVALTVANANLIWQLAGTGAWEGNLSEMRADSPQHHRVRRA